MKTSTFITLFNTKINQLKTVNEQNIIAAIEELIKPVEYIPYEDKIKLVSSVVEAKYNTKYKTPERHRQFIIALVNAYTKLEMSIQDFDVLCANKLLDPIISTFKSEYIICDSLMKMIIDDLLMNDGR